MCAGLCQEIREKAFITGEQSVERKASSVIDADVKERLMGSRPICAISAAGVNRCKEFVTRLQHLGEYD